ncbi:Aste57867_2055 [Aphanomyces stellatus]|uniref:Aste57867_2055 protein n=1 Tax=Aphanomyces stellatus TaxID=120398 RepID=A0A485KAB4_9STRA|nr:hypothetical protein As57867_002051 [Aphanomyces stellatus]VFT79259.1 Aste57867_2055 [Aphanomyces stellatus]
MDDDELARERFEVTSFNTIMAPLVESTLARVAAASPKPQRAAIKSPLLVAAAPSPRQTSRKLRGNSVLRPHSANVVVLPRHRTVSGPPAQLLPSSPTAGTQPSDSTNMTLASPRTTHRPAKPESLYAQTHDRSHNNARPKTAASRLPKSNQISPASPTALVIDIPPHDHVASPCSSKGGVRRPTTALSSTRHNPTTSPTTTLTIASPSPRPQSHSNAIQRAKLLANKLVRRPKSAAAVEPHSFISGDSGSIIAAKKRPRPPSAWAFMQSHTAPLFFEPLSPSGLVDQVSVDLTKKEVALQRDVTAAACKRFNDIRHQRTTKQLELDAIRRQVAAMTKEMTTTTAESSSCAGLARHARTLQDKIARDKDECAKCRHYKRVLEHMLERVKWDAAAIAARVKAIHTRTAVAEKEWARLLWTALDSRKYSLDNAVAQTQRRLDQLRADQATCCSDHAATLHLLRSEMEQTQELARRRAEADRKRRNLVMTFRVPGDKKPSLTRVNTQLLLLREAALTTREAEFDWLVAKSGEGDLKLLQDRFMGFDTDMQVLQQLLGDSVAMHGQLDKDYARVSAEVFDLRNCGMDEISETQRKVKGMLEDELWVAQANEEHARVTMAYHQHLVTAMHQGLQSILQWLDCVDPVRCGGSFKGLALESLPLTCIHLVQTHLTNVSLYSTEALQEVLEQLPVRLWARTTRESVVGLDLDLDRRVVQTTNHENDTRQSHDARLGEAKAQCDAKAPT